MIPGFSKDTPTKPRPHIMDSLRRSGTIENQQLQTTSTPAPLDPPYADFSSQEFLDDSILAASLEHMLLKPQDTSMPLSDKVQLMISGSAEVFSCPEFEQIIHSHLRTNAPTIIHTALGCDFAAMSRAREVSYFSEYCAVCNYRFDSSDTVWLHTCSHVTLLNPGASVYTLGKLAASIPGYLQSSWGTILTYSCASCIEAAICSPCDCPALWISTTARCSR